MQFHIWGILLLMKINIRIMNAKIGQYCFSSGVESATNKLEDVRAIYARQLKDYKRINQIKLRRKSFKAQLLTANIAHGSERINVEAVE
jgi:hypothetical protein